MSYLCLLEHSDVQHILCCIFALFFFVLYDMYCQFIWIVYFWLPLPYSLTFISTNINKTNIFTSHLKSLNIEKECDIGNPGPGLGQEQHVEGFNWLMGTKPFPFGNYIYLFINLFVGRHMSYLRSLCLFAHSNAQHILCCVFDLLFFVLYNLRWQFIWIVHFWLPLRYSLTFISTNINKANKIISHHSKISRHRKSRSWLRTDTNCGGVQLINGIQALPFW